MASIESHPAPLNQRLAFTQVLPWAVFSKEEAASWDMKIHQKNHHVSDETPWVFQAKVFQKLPW